jgi:hypothetical protein
MRLRTFLCIDVLGALTTRALYIYLGYRIGQPAVEVVEVIARYSLWISLALLAGIIVNALRQRSRRGRDDPARAPAQADADPEAGGDPEADAEAEVEDEVDQPRASDKPQASGGGSS